MKSKFKSNGRSYLPIIAIALGLFAVLFMLKSCPRFKRKELPDQTLKNRSSLTELTEYRPPTEAEFKEIEAFLKRSQLDDFQRYIHPDKFDPRIADSRWLPNSKEWKDIVDRVAGLSSKGNYYADEARLTDDDLKAFDAWKHEPFDVGSLEDRLALAADFRKLKPRGQPWSKGQNWRPVLAAGEVKFDIIRSSIRVSKAGTRADATVDEAWFWIENGPDGKHVKEPVYFPHICPYRLIRGGNGWIVESSGTDTASP